MPAWLDSLAWRRLPAYRRWIVRRAHVASLRASEVALAEELEYLACARQAIDNLELKRLLEG
jgi:hypothetical protein